MNHQPRIRYAQIGVGHAHANKLDVYRRSPDYEVMGVAEPDDALRRRAAARPEFRDLTWLTTEQLLNTPGLQVVGVETEVKHLLPQARQCIDAGLHIHLDKPAGEDLPAFEALLQEAARRHLAVQLGYMYRYHPAMRQLRQFLDQGWLGEPFELHAVMSKTVDNAARAALAEYAGGAMFELGCHLMDLVVWFLGPPAKVHAYPRRSREDESLQDNMLAVLEYPAATASVRSSVIEVEGFARRHLVLCGTEGTMHIQPLDQPQARVAFASPRGDYTRGYQELKYPRFDRYVADAAELAQVVRHEKDPEFSYEHDLAVQRALLQACSATPG